MKYCFLGRNLTFYTQIAIQINSNLFWTRNYMVGVTTRWWQWLDIENAEERWGFPIPLSQEDNSLQDATGSSSNVDGVCSLLADALLEAKVPWRSGLLGGSAFLNLWLQGAFFRPVFPDLIILEISRSGMEPVLYLPVFLVSKWAECISLQE